MFVGDAVLGWGFGWGLGFCMFPGPAVMGFLVVGPFNRALIVAGLSPCSLMTATLFKV